MVNRSVLVRTIFGIMVPIHHRVLSAVLKWLSSTTPAYRSGLMVGMGTPYKSDVVYGDYTIVMRISEAMLCTWACIMAKGSECSCACHGENHGKGRLADAPTCHWKKRPRHAIGSINRPKRNVHELNLI